ncbi:MAG: IS4 family transposase [Rhodospirillales bacterium]
MSGRTLAKPPIHDFVDAVFAEDLHAKRVLSLSNAALGVLTTASLAICTIGQGLAAATGGSSKCSVKQVDRLLSNPGIDIDALQAVWVPYAIGGRTQINVAMDWTEFHADAQSTLMLSLIGHHGRAIPLLWISVRNAEMKDRRSAIEENLLRRLAELLPTEICVCIVADRGFASVRLYRLMTEQLRFDYVVRFRGDVLVTSEQGQTQHATEWVGPQGGARLLRRAAVTAEQFSVGTVLCLRDRGMKEPWCLAASSQTADKRALTALYGSRWTIESGFRDVKDRRFGLGMGEIRVSTPERRDRLWLVAALAIAFLTVLGASGEALGYDRMLKTNTAKTRQHSLFRQGCMLYELIPNMPKERLLPLIKRFAAELENLALFGMVFPTSPK